MKIKNNNNHESKNYIIIKEIFSILKHESIKSYEDIERLTLDKNNLLSAQRYPWIGEIAELAVNLYYNAERHIRDIEGQIFLVNKVKPSNYQDIMKYSCIFPNRTIMSTGNLFYSNEKQYSFIDIDFFFKLFNCKNMLLQGIVDISPYSYCVDFVKGAANYEDSIITNLELPDSNKKKIAELDQCGFGNYQNNNPINKLFIAMPWLENARIEDYIDIVNKYRTEFEYYNFCLANMSELTNDIDSFINKYIYDYQEANINIQIALEKKKAELKKQGIHTAISICLTIVPYVLTKTGIDINMLQAILGSVTVKEILDSANIYTEMKNTGIDNPFWVMWKWRNK